MQREFELPVEDKEHLESLEDQGISWETIQESNNNWLLIHNWPVPVGYNEERVSVALSIPSMYPDAQIDMAYFSPSLQRKDGKPINAANQNQLIGGKNWQRWSRHRTAENQWRAGTDNLSTHLTQVKNWFEREFRKV
jgi:hypothetical protein